MAEMETTYSLSAAHDHEHCIVCGESNPLSLRLSFALSEDGSVTGHFKAQARFQGYNGILHGGITASLLDAAMTHCLFHQGIEAYTADLHVRYAHAIPCEAQLDIRALMVGQRPPLFRLRAEITCQDRLVA